MNYYRFRDCLKLIIKYVMRTCLKVYWLIPIRKKTIFFMANMGKGYLCNPKYIYESVMADDRYKDYKLIWAFKEPDSIDKKHFDYRTILVSKKKYIKFFFYLLTSQVVIYNCFGFSYAPIRKHQLLIETGHGGGPFKKVGFSAENKSKASKKGVELSSRDIKLYLSVGKKHAALGIREAMMYKGDILFSGFPRNDIFFCKNEVAEFKKTEIRNRLGLKDHQRVVLYAPTFKGDEHHAVCFTENSDLINPKFVKKALSDRFGGEWVFAIRGHQYTQDIELPGSDRDWTSYDDMQELLLIADVLITDYSSSVWDFALTRKPCFLYVPDLDYYSKSERGFWIPIDVWPGIIVNNNSEWNQTIINYDEDEYRNKINEYFLLLGSCENGTACEQVKEYILKYLGEKSESYRLYN